MNELYEHLRRHLREMWLRRWIGLAAAWLVALIGVVIVYRIPERYEATARVYVDTQSLLQPLMAGLAISPNVDQQVQLISRTLISRPNVEKVVRMADLDLAAKSPPDREELIERVAKTISLSSSTTPNLYFISYRDPSPEQARTVVQSLLTIFVESSLGEKKQDSRAAVQFLDDQIKRYEESLKSAEARLKEFKLRYLGIADREGGYFARIAGLQQALETARLNLSTAEQTRDSYKKELQGEQPVFLPETPTATQRANEPPAAPALDARLATLRNVLDELLRKYTERHPDVVATNRRIAQLEEEKREIEAARRAAAPSPERSARTQVDRNPVFQQLRISVAESEAQVAAARAKVAGLEAQQRSLKGQAQMVPQIEAEYTQLNRDYDVQKKTYESLLTRRESAGLGQDVQDRSGAQFRVIDPPRVLPTPVAPNRIGLLGIALLAAVAAGLLVSFTASQVKPTFADARALRESIKRPVLGMVSMVPNPAIKRSHRRAAALFAGGVSAFFAAFAGVFAFTLLLARGAA
ncbi:MAG TPA: XrtA system polysaccharide chain length determinant [Casimicrobiaceae bacterium]|nr:XrtA system polysaccharide chain length determinant [Casimicrobiaceae bacterium]